MATDKEKAEKPSRTRKNPLKKTTSMRESAAKSRASADKPKRVRKARSAAGKPINATKKALTKEFHLIEQKGEGSFFTKSRSFTPGFLSRAWQELRQVTWPNNRDTWRLMFAVLVFATALGLFIAALDFVLEKILREIII